MSTKTKKISYMSVIILIVAGTVGAGIFFKNSTLNQMAQGHFGIVMATWGVAIFGMLAIALSLIEVSSAQKTNRGTLEWTKLFTPGWIHNSSSNYLKWFFVPITLFTMSLYITKALEDAGMQVHKEIYVLLISFAFFVWFAATNYFSLRFAEISQWITTTFQLIPLLVFPIIGLIHSGDVEGTILNKVVEAKHGLTGTSPWLATIAGVSAISFAYDGFYSAASLRNEMKNENKIGRSLVGGVIVISFIYLFITIGFQVAGNGSITGLKKFMSSRLFNILNIFIAFGVSGIVNSFVMSFVRQLADISKNKDSKEVIVIQKIIYRKKIKPNNKHQLFTASWVYVFGLTTLFFIVLGPIGGYLYTINESRNSSGGNHSYAFADTLTNFTSLLIFIIITNSILGALINRKSNKVKVKKFKLFKPAAIISIAINYLAGLYMIIAAVVDSTGYNGADMQGSIIKISIFISILVISIIPGIYQSKKINLK